MSFLCEGKIEGKDVKMSGIIEQETEGIVKCHPKYGLTPEKEEWIDTSDEPAKEFNIQGEEVMFDKVVLKKIS